MPLCVHSVSPFDGERQLSNFAADLRFTNGIGYDAVKSFSSRRRNDESFHGMSEEKITNPVHFRLVARVLHRDLNSRGVNTVIGYLLIAIAELRRANCGYIQSRQHRAESASYMFQLPYLLHKKKPRMCEA